MEKYIMKKLLQRINENKYIIIIAIIVILRFVFSANIPNFYIKNMPIDDGLMINQMMSLSQRTLFRCILSKNSYKGNRIPSIFVFS